MSADQTPERAELREQLTHLKCKVEMGDDTTHVITVKLPDHQVDAILTLIHAEADRLARERIATMRRLLPKILKTLQYGTIMSDNTEPMLTNNLNIALAAVDSVIAGEVKRLQS